MTLALSPRSIGFSVSNRPKNTELPLCFGIFYAGARSLTLSMGAAPVLEIAAATPLNIKFSAKLSFTCFFSDISKRLNLEFK
ncbi:hypothetical protein KUTeg_020378 [Tegillarca granosa]|uniref:Uncharacterized protein n=1 Tax=Tegillarca granosa TaxID=220873 RepID=A0ABQ9EC34_TEGGR|nr:hypothetical protein KUTeg_020378 [Tegillarca granosa]